MQTWFITGVSTGLGRALAQEVLAQGGRVAGTVRDEAKRLAFEALSPGRSFGFLLDLTSFDDAAALAEDVEKRVGPIDILVNNAGYGFEGPIEETPLEEVRLQYEVNVFGALRLIQAVLPSMRRRRAGHIINVTSMGGLTSAFPGVGIYNSSKSALEGINGALAAEVKNFGIRVTAVEPGGFRTDWAGRSMRRGERTIADYDESFEPQRQQRRDRSGKQIGDPVKAAKIMVRLTQVDNPPVRLLLGSDALTLVRAALAEINREIDTWEDWTLSTDADEG
jgi:NAD(P)-dependent dehydrogenase (short-subunit alcohol dehydrogenase family)